MPLAGPPLDAPIDLAQILANGLDTKPDAEALVSRSDRWTWRRLDTVSTRLAGSYLDLGLAPGNRIATLMPNRTTLIVHYLACMKCGLVAVPLNYRYMAPEIDHALEVSEAALLVAHAERDSDIGDSKLAAKLPLGTVSYEAADGRSPSLEGLIRSAPPDLALPAVDPAAPAVIFFTSGSTGPPKGVTHTADSLGWMVASTVSGLKLRSNDTFMTASSLSHEGGFRFAFAVLSVGATVAIARHFDPDEYLPLMRQVRPTVMWILPAALFRLVEDQGATRQDFASLRYCASGADKLPAELEHEFEEKAGFQIHETYGMTEIGGAAGNLPDRPTKPGSVGPLMPSYEAVVRDGAGNEQPINAQGRLWIRSPTTMIGYWGRADATAEVLVDGWLDTGDVMSVDDDGYLWFAGRKKQIIVHDGSNISPQEVEDALLAHPAVAAAGVVGVHDLAHGENVRAYVTLHPGVAASSASELIAFARQRIGYKAPEDIVFLDEMPLSPVGKVDRTALKKMAEAQMQDAVSWVGKQSM